MKSLNDIKDQLESKKGFLYKKYPIKSLALFGSYARNEQDDMSDVDILVDFNKGVGVEFIDLADELEDLLAVKVDLVSHNGIKSKYYDSIKKDLIYVS